MIGRIVSGLMVVGLMGGGCQSAPVAATQTGAQVPATRTAATAPIAYSHAEAMKLYRAAKYKEGEVLCKAAIADIEKQSGTKSRDLADPLDDLATIYLRLAKFNDAKPVIERAESVLDPKVPADAILLGRLSINKGWRLYALQEIDAAEKVFEHGRELLEKNQKGDSLELAEVINNLALTYADTEDPDEEPTPERLSKAKVMLFKSWQMRRKLAGDNSPEAAESLNNIGMHLLYHAEEEDDPETAMNTLKKALETTEKVYGPEHPETAVSHANLSAALHLAEDDKAADEHARKALAITEKTLGKDHLDRAYELQLLGNLQEGDGKTAEAEASFKEAVRILEVTFGPNHVNVASALEDLRNLYETTGDEAKERAVAARIRRMRGKEI